MVLAIGSTWPSNSAQSTGFMRSPWKKMQTSREHPSKVHEIGSKPIEIDSKPMKKL